MWNERRLPRLPRSNYQGFACVFWTHVAEGRSKDWLCSEFHCLFRETLLHTLARYRLTCPIYVLMPDHFHLLWHGASPLADQLNATRFLRKNLPIAFEKQAYDHVLREEERRADRLADTVEYILANPVRAKLVGSSNEWPWYGRMVAGYPNLERDNANSFWKCHNAYVDSL